MKNGIRRTMLALLAVVLLLGAALPAAWAETAADKIREMAQTAVTAAEETAQKVEAAAEETAQAAEETAQKVEAAAEETAQAAETAVDEAAQKAEETAQKAETAAEEAAQKAEEAAEKKEEKTPGWLHNAVKKFGETPLKAWIAFGTLIVLAVVLRAVAGTAKKWNPKMLSFGALSIALSFILSMIRLFRMPTGGSVTPASMLPIMLFAATYGIGPGMLAGLAYGLLQYLQGGWFLNIWQFILDYPLAFAMLGLAGLYQHLKVKGKLYIAIGAGALGRVVCAFAAGLMWAADSVSSGEQLVIQNTVYQSKALYSIVYNGLYLIPDTLICILLAIAVGKQIMKIMKAE